MKAQPSPTVRRRRLALPRARLRDDSLSRKATLNMLAAVLDYTARIVVGLIVTPVLVSRLGDVLFGVYQTLGRLVGFAAPAGGRPSQALKWTIARDQHSSAYHEKRLQVGSAMAVWLLFLPPLAIVGGALAWVSPVLLGLPEDLHTTVRIAAGLLVANLVVMNLLSIPQSVVQGENLGYKRMGLSTVLVVAGGGLVLVAAEAGAGLVGVTAAVVVTTVATGLLFLHVARSNVGWFGAARPSMRTVRSFLTLSGWFVAWNIVIHLMRAGDVVVLGIAGSPADVTLYTLVRYLPEAIFSAAAIVISAIMPGLGGVLGAGHTRQAASVRSESMTATWLLATSTGAAFLLVHPSLLTVWVGPQYRPEPLAALLIVVMTLQFAFIRNDASIIDLTLQLRGKVVLGLVSAAASIALAVLCIRGLGLGVTGLAIGFIAGRSVVSLAYPWFVCRSLSLAFRDQARAAVRPLVVSAAAFTAALMLSPSAEVDSWLGVGTVGALGLVAFGGASFALGLSAMQRARLLRRLRRLGGRP